MLNSFPELFVFVFVGMILFCIAVAVLIIWLGLVIMNWATDDCGFD